MPRPLTIAFLLLSLPTVVMLALITPPGQVADEPAHIARAAGLLLGEIAGHRGTVDGPNGKPITMSGIWAEPALYAAAAVLPGSGGPPQPFTRAAVEQARGYGWSGQRYFLAIGGIALYMPVLYVPGAIGVELAHLSGASPFDAILSGRIANCLAFMAIGVAALQIARRGRALMFCALALPMTLSLAGSMNEDGLLIAASILVSALASRAGSCDRVAAACVVACLGAVKLPYVVLAALLVAPLPPLAAWRTNRRALLGRAALAGLAILPGAAWTAWMVAAVATPSARAPYHPGPLWPGDPARMFEGTDTAAQLTVLRHAPWHLLDLPIGLLDQAGWLGMQTVGWFGWLNIPLPHSIYAVWGAGLVLALVADLTRVAQPGARWTESALFLAAALACLWAIALVQYVTWTNVGLDHIEGVQGRYFLPLFGLVALALPRIALPGARWISAACTLGPIIAASCGLVMLPQLIIAAYYVH